MSCQAWGETCGHPQSFGGHIPCHCTSVLHGSDKQPSDCWDGERGNTDYTDWHPLGASIVTLLAAKIVLHPGPQDILNIYLVVLLRELLILLGFLIASVICAVNGETLHLRREGIMGPHYQAW